MWGWRTDVERQGETLLNRGMETANQSQLGTGLQVNSNPIFFMSFYYY